MNRKTISMLVMLLATMALAVVLAAQQPAASEPTAQASAQTAGQSDASASAAKPATQGEGSSAGGEMPHTASPLPLVALMGLLSVGAGAAAHRFSKRLTER